MTSECESDTAKLVQMMCRKLAEAINRQSVDVLPGGKCWDPSPELAQQAHSCHAMNVSGDRVFGHVDAALKRAPNVPVEKLEAKVMFSSNKTADWLAFKSPTDRYEAVSTARTRGCALLTIEKSRKETYKAHTAKAEM